MAAAVCHVASMSLAVAPAAVRPSFTRSATATFAVKPTATAPRRRALQVSAQTAVDMDKLVADIKGLTLEQARTLTDRLQEELGVSAAAMMPMGGGGGGAAAPAEAAPVVEEKTEFDLVLEEVPSNARIAVIKVVRTLTGLGLKEAKDLIEGLPKKIKEAAPKEDAEEGKKQLEGVGAKCSVK